MPVKPSGGQPKGLTVFGTTLTRQQTIIGAAVLAVIVLVLLLVVPRTFGGSDDDKSQGRKPGAGPIASTTAAATPSAVASAAAPTTQPTSAAATTAAAKPSTASSGVAVTLPAGWHLYTDQQYGFKVPVPANWSVSKQNGTETWFTENTGLHRLLIIDQTRTPASNPVADWQSKEDDRRGSYANYHGIKIVSVNYWDKAADWEYTFTSGSGNKIHVDKRGFITAKDQAYGITWEVTDSAWKANLPNLALIYKGFIPARS
jgi:hypothetical protein